MMRLMETQNPATQSRMPFSESWWQHYNITGADSLETDVKGYFIALLIHCAEGENNLIPYNMRLISRNAMPGDDDMQVAGNSDENDNQGGVS